MRRLSLLLALAAISTAVAGGQSSPAPTPLAPAPATARMPQIVSPEWLAKQRQDAPLVLLHVGTADDYAAAHLEGARLARVVDVSVSDTARKLSVEMPGADTLRARLAALGVADNTRVVVYFAKDMVYPATRILFTLLFAGFDGRAALLDGGLPAWVAAGHPVVTSSAVAAPDAVGRAGAATLSPLALRNFVVDAAYVQSMLGRPGVSVVDARDSVFYRGERQGGSPQAPHRAGHVPGARSVPWQGLYDEQRRLKPREELARIFTAAGVGPGDVVIGYCHTGQQGRPPC